MKRFDLYLKRRLTSGSLTIYSLPVRESLYSVFKMVVGQRLLSSHLFKKADGKGNIAVGAETEKTRKTCSQSIEAEIGLNLSSHSSVNVMESGKTWVCISILSEVVTGCHVFAGASLSIGHGCSVAKSGSVKDAGTETLGVAVSHTKPESRKNGKLNYHGGVLVKIDSGDASAYEAVSANPTGPLSIAVSASGGPVKRRLRLLSEMDAHTLGELDGSTLDELDYVEIT